MKSVLIALLLPALCWAQINDRETTLAGEYTGYFWLNLAPTSRLYFVIGFSTGYSAAKPDNRAAQTAKKDACLATLQDPSFEQKMDCTFGSIDATSEAYEYWKDLDPQPGGSYTYGDIVAATDKFFYEPENRVMPIVAAWRIAKMKQEGRPQSEVDRQMDQLREFYIRDVRKACESGGLGVMTASRCEAVGARLKPTPAK